MSLGSAIASGVLVATWAARKSGSNGNAMVYTIVSSSSDGSQDVDAIQDLLGRSVETGHVRLVGRFVLNDGPIHIPDGVHLDLSEAEIVQTKPLTPVFSLGSGVSVTGGTVSGLGKDWVNSSEVYSASAFVLNKGAAEVLISEVVAQNFSGAGVFVPAGATNLKLSNCRLSGAGSVIPPRVGQYSAGLVATDSINGLSIEGGRIDGFAHGVSIGRVSSLRLSGGLKISANGQHGVYIGSAINGIVSDVYIEAAPLQGIKFQVDPTDSNGIDGLVVENVSVQKTGSHGVLISNLSTISPACRGLVIRDVRVEFPADSGGDGIVVMDSIGANISRVDVAGGRHGIRIQKSSSLNAHSNILENQTVAAVLLVEVSESRIVRNVIKRSAGLPSTGSSSSVALSINPSADVTITDNTILGF